MKLLYLDLAMGAAGDMLTAALYELLNEDDRKDFLERITSAGIDGVETIAEPSVKCGIKGTHMKVLIEGHEEDDHHHDHNHDHHHDRDHSHEHDHSHDHGHDHDEGHNEEHSHHHSSMHDIKHLIEDLKISDKVKKDAVSVYNLIAEAESHAHGVPVTEIHFHEVGTKDAVMDVVSVCMLMDMIGADKVMASGINVGSGHVHCAHGILPVPAPATAYILKDIPIYQGHIESELCTPTGAALLKHYVSKYREMPLMRVSSIGYGMGKKDFEQANCVRAFLGECDEEGQVVEFTCNVDDMTGERIGYAMDVFFKAGALEVYTIPVGMKKSRPGIELKVMCRSVDKDRILELIFKHTTTLGIRENTSRRYALKRRIEEVETAYGPIKRKISEGFGVRREKWEYDDIARIAGERDIPVEDVISGLKGNV
ncbi:MAG: nickel pincer cofactor biosynthesis protein LarC [Lachnospiraceae bacterium]|nr:nickel pincer cofactor biosynthesis protein LarC [Lachnospiraceae bacterium]